MSTVGAAFASVFGRAMARGPLALAVVLLAGCGPDAARTRNAPLARKPHPRAIVPLNAEVARGTRVDAVRPGGSSGVSLTGAGVLVAEWDEAAARDTHRDLLGRVVIREGTGLSEHASHVAATIIGSGAGDPLALGMAPEATLYSYSWALDVLEMAAIGPFVSASSHAYGDALGWQTNPDCPEVWSWAGQDREREDGRFGRYGPVVASIDRVVREADILSVWAAGNDRDDGPTATVERHAHFPSCREDFSDSHKAEVELGYGTIGGPAVAKNVLTVGAIRDLPEIWSSGSIVPHDASSFGPTDDGRIKPDLVAGGEDVWSASTVADDAYATQSGTSSAAAAVTGIAALLIEAYRATHAGRDPRAAELKAVLVQTALDAEARGPDYRTGHGLVDARAAADFVQADGTDPRLRVDVASGARNELVTDEVPEGTALRATLAWLDPPGPARDAPDDPTPVLQNDLDLSLVAPDGLTIFHPWSLDGGRPDSRASRTGPNRLDNVEVVDVDAADNTFSGTWTLRVETPNGLLRGAPQAYALAASVPLSRPARPVAGSATRVKLEAAPNDSATLSLPITNLGRGTFEWTATTDAPFLRLEAPSGADGDELVLTATALPSAARFGKVTLESSDPGGSRTLGVVIDVACARDCSVRECGLDPACGAPCGRCPAESACSFDGFCDQQSEGCPAADLGSALGSAVVTGATTGSSSSEGRCGGELSPERGFSWAAPSAGRYVFSTEGSRFDTVLSLRRGGCIGTEVDCSDDTIDLSSSLVVDLEAGEAVTAVVDGFNGASGPFQLGIHEVVCPDGDLGRHLGQNVLREASPGRIDRLQVSCAVGAAREAALSFTAPAPGTYRFDASSSNFGASVAVLENSCRGTELVCTPETAEVALAAGQRVVVVIDGATRPDDRFGLVVTTRDLSCDGDCSRAPGDGLCACDERCVALGDCCVDACGECASCTPDQDCEFGRCIPRRCTGGACGCGQATGGTGAAGCDAGAGGVPGEAGGPTGEVPMAAVEGSGCFCRAVPARRPHGPAWLGIALGLGLLASRRRRI